MTFFNKKEDVIDVELTPYGKYLLSKGQFQPVYYEFYDDDIIYDSGYANVQEIQGEIQPRIEQTPILKTQYTFESAEKRMKEYKEKLRILGKNVESILEKRNNFSFSSLPLGNTAGNTNSAPSLLINFLQGDIDTYNLLDSKGLPGNIRELILRPIKTEIGIKKVGRYETINEIRDIEQTELIINEEKIVVSKKEDFLLIDLQEFEVGYRNDNFEIYMYELVEDERTGEIVEKQLSFKKEYSNVVDGILYETDERPAQESSDTKEYVEYYFSFLKDKQIPGSILCKYLSSEQIDKLNAIDKFDINCEQTEEQAISTIRRVKADVEEC